MPDRRIWDGNWTVFLNFTYVRKYHFWISILNLGNISHWTTQSNDQSDLLRSILEFCLNFHLRIFCICFFFVCVPPPCASCIQIDGEEKIILVHAFPTEISDTKCCIQSEHDWMPAAKTFYETLNKCRQTAIHVIHVRQWGILPMKMIIIYTKQEHWNFIKTTFFAYGSGFEV